ncbi:alginate lyase family protein [Gilvimarinus sp. DA14]|uniref:alginate lyase family protein n=1 Tax=Gilvimarinus sp. DA14 TaxID=2956798 RepID=UPI0020B64637|nr:alginate lyase family protein [Gilvimarinus sp. DA14]UTF61110.1 alginate lyase family protein [Gilvimarinus sp. DA14]
MRFSVLMFMALLSPLAFTQTLTNPYHYNEDTSADYRNLLASNYRCDQSLIPAYKGDLVIDSKYDQSDSSKSSVTSSYDSDSAQKAEHIRALMSFIAQQSHSAIYQTSASTRARAAQCISDNLNLWAAADSLLGVKTSPTGVAQRKWFLAAIASVLMQLDSRYTDFYLDSRINNWLDDLAYQVVDDYNYRLEAESDRINNHDYWAAWSVAARALLSDDTRLLQWSEDVFDFAMSQIVLHKSTGLGYLPRELDRGSLAANYHNYAMVPLMYLADALVLNGKDITPYRDQLGALASLTTRFVVDTNSLDSYIGAKQKSVSPGKSVWILPYAVLFGIDENVNSILKANKLTTEYSQMGGDLWSFYQSRVSQ